MADDHTRSFTKEEFQGVVNGLKGRIDQSSCRFCGSTEALQLEDKIYHLQSTTRTADGSWTALDHTKIFPVVVMMCHNCGFTYLFNALYLKVMKPSGEIIPGEVD